MFVAFIFYRCFGTVDFFEFTWFACEFDQLKPKQSWEKKIQQNQLECIWEVGKKAQETKLSYNKCMDGMVKQQLAYIYANMQIYLFTSNGMDTGGLKSV